MAKKKASQKVKEYLKERFSPKKKTTQQKEVEFNLMAKAMVTPKPKTKEIKK